MRSPSRQKIFVPVFLAGLLFASAASSAEPQGLSRLQAFLDGRDEISETAEVPESLRLEIAPGDIRAAYDTSLELWKRDVDLSKIAASTEKILQSGTRSEKEAAQDKVIRSRFKHLRFAFVDFGKNHQYPKELDRLTAVMGHLEDARKNGIPELTRKEAQRLKDLLENRSFRARLQSELETFKPASVKNFQAWRDGEFRVMGEVLARKKLTAHEFHEMRKAVGRQVSAFYALNAVHPSNHLDDSIAYFQRINSKMGEDHDEMVKLRLNGREDEYFESKMTMPREIRELMTPLVRKYSLESTVCGPKMLKRLKKLLEQNPD